MMVLDASAMLAYLFRETGYDIVSQVIENSCISTVNFSEVVTRLIRDGINAERFAEECQKTSIEIIPFNQKQALLAARLVCQTKDYGLSLEDRCCLALAMEKEMDVITADPAWLRLSGFPGRIVLIR